MKDGNSNVQVHQPSSFDNTEEQNENRLLNIVFQDQTYYAYEPGYFDDPQENVIDSKLWLIARFAQNVGYFL